MQHAEQMHIEPELSECLLRSHKEIYTGASCNSKLNEKVSLFKLSTQMDEVTYVEVHNLNYNVTLMVTRSQNDCQIANTYTYWFCLPQLCGHGYNPQMASSQSTSRPQSTR